METDGQNQNSFLLPSFVDRLQNPEIKTVMLCGCGGGFDFVHSMNLYPELRRLNKQVVIVSYSFGSVYAIEGEAPIVWDQEDVLVKLVTAKSKPDPTYGPEVYMASFLDSQYPLTAPHEIYACNAREFTVPLLKKFYTEIVNKHNVDAVVIFDGGSDSLMKGDEEGLGDPIEDCVSVTAVSQLQGLKSKILISAGFGADRFNHVSDASSLRAISELTRSGGFLGSLSLEPTSKGFNFYCNCIKHIYDHQTFRSVLTGLVVAATNGYYGFDLPKNEEDPTSTVDVGLQTRVRTGSTFVWPLMGMLFAFDVDVVVERSLIAKWIREMKTVSDCYKALREGRAKLKKEGKLRPVENLPGHEQMRSK